MKVLTQSRNALYFAMSGQLSEMYDNHTTELKKFDECNSEGDVLIALSKAPVAFSEEQPSTDNYFIQDLIRDEITDIIEVESNFNHMMNFFNGLYSEDTLKIFGAMVIYDQKRINPLHPIIADMIAEGKIVLPDKFKLIIYTMSEKSLPNKDRLNESLKTIGLSLAYKNSIKSVEQSTKIRESKEDLLAYFRSSLTNRVATDILRKTLTKEVSGEDSRYALVPVQKMSTGMMYPYYGLAGFTYAGDTYQSVNMYAFRSGNLSSKHYSRFAGTCTGSQPSNRYESLYVINDMNINSLYYDDTVPYYWEYFVLACQVTSITLLKGMNNGKTTTSEHKSETTTTEGEEDDQAHLREQRDTDNVPF